MPAALEVNWEEVRMLAVSIGVREAARKLGLGESAVMQRSAREGWIRDLPRSTPLPVTMLKPVSGVSSPANVQRNILVEKLLETRENHLDGALAASREIKKKTGQQILDDIDTVLAAGKHAALVGGWNADSRPDSPGKAFGSRGAGLEVDAEVIVTDAEEIVPIPDGVSTNVDDY